MRRRSFLLGGSLAMAQRARGAFDPASVKALTFDVFGTVVDWRGSIIREGADYWRAKGVKVDWGKFADAWRAGYGPSMDRVRRGELPWAPLDKLHRMTLDRLLEEFHVTGLSEAQKDDLNRVWHRLDGWPDAVTGLTRLKKKYVIATLSNGNVALLTNMAKHAGLPWDCILSAELARHYKPDPEAYQTAADLLGLRPQQVMMVAAHPGDLQAASRVEFRTAYVPRPLENGPERKSAAGSGAGFDVFAMDFVELAGRLGAQP